jgi:hypothetical protein
MSLSVGLQVLRLSWRVLRAAALVLFATPFKFTLLKNSEQASAASSPFSRIPQIARLLELSQEREPETLG